jgi:hypothetical protein
MTPDDDPSVAIIVAVIPPAVQSAIMLIEPEARTTVVTVAVVAPITPYIDAESACACGRGCTDGDGRQSGQHEFSHGSSPLVVTSSKQMPPWSVAGNTEKLS